MLERNREKLLFACRWLLAPMYLGLALGLLALGVKFFQEVLHSLAGILTLAESDLVLSVLSLIDIVLVGSLIVMVMLSGYRASHRERQDPLVCRVTSDIRRVGSPAGRSRPDRFRSHRDS
jgi:uncharacterized protein (TIGR00645 family)